MSGFSSLDTILIASFTLMFSVCLLCASALFGATNCEHISSKDAAIIKELMRFSVVLSLLALLS